MILRVMANEIKKAQILKSGYEINKKYPELQFFKEEKFLQSQKKKNKFLLENKKTKITKEGESPVLNFFYFSWLKWIFSFEEQCCLEVQHKMGGKLHLKLNIDRKPIAKKYREGKMKSTLKKE